MKRGKFASLKQKIICIPIIIVTLISFIIPNYAHAGAGDTAFEMIQDILLLIPDALMIYFERMFVPGKSEIEEEKIFVKINGEDDYNDFLNNTMIAGGFLNPFISSKWLFSKIPIVGDIQYWFDNKILKFFGAGKESFVISNFSYSPKEIISNKIPAFGVNFFKKDKDYSSDEKKYSVAYQLQNIIATWYVSLRNICLVLMLIILVFIGIKITISSVASDKAKYKQLLIDWIVAICLLIFMHYIMMFAVNIVESLIDMISYSEGTEDFINLARTQAGMPVSEETKVTLSSKFFWSVIYLVLFMYTLIFTWQYLKRVIKLAFLTLIAPIMALSYPIDKMTDGQAQGINKFFKDYIYELAVPIVHLIVWDILISSVQALAMTNSVYAIVAIGSVMFLERTLREYLQFDRGHVKPPNPAGLLAAASIGKTAMNALLPSNVKNKSGKGSGGDSLGDSSAEKPIDTSRGDNPYALLAGGNDENDENGKGKNNTNGNLPKDKQDENLLKDPKDEKGKGYGNGPISDKQEDWDALRAAQKDAEMARIAQQNKKRNIMKPANLRKNIVGAGKKLKNSKFARGAGAVGKKYARKLTGGKTGIRGIAHVAAGVAKVGAGLTGAVVLGTAGAAMGIAMGDVSKGAQLIAGGLATGYAGGSKLTGAATGLIGKGVNTVSDIAGTYNSAVDPAGYEKKLQEKEQKRIVSEIRDNEAAMRMFRIKNENMSDEDIVSGINECVSQGIDNVEDIQKVFDLQEKAGINKNMAMGAVKISKGTSASELRNEGKTEDLRRSIQNNISGPNAEKQSYDAIDILRKIHKVDLMDSKRSSYAEAMAKQTKTQGKKPEPVKPRNEGQGSSKKGPTRRSPRMK